MSRQPATKATGACYCGAAGHLYPCGYRCVSHTPAALAGRPEPDRDRYCAPARCYCGSCPSWTPDTTWRPGETIIDLRVKASGKRRSGPAAYADARRALNPPPMATLKPCARCGTALDGALTGAGITTHPCCAPDADPWPGHPGAGRAETEALARWTASTRPEPEAS